MKAIRHFGIVVTDIEKSLEFYRDLLGFEIKVDALEEGEFIDELLGLQKVKVRTVKMAADDGYLVELLYYHSHQGNKRETNNIFDVGASHVAFTVYNLDEEYKKLTEKGVKFVNPPKVSPNGKAKVAFCYDPDGVPIELVEEL